jgi:hypothetical protein
MQLLRRQINKQPVKVKYTEKEKDYSAANLVIGIYILLLTKQHIAHGRE